MPDLKDMIDGIERTEDITSGLESKVEKLQQIIEKQKKTLAEQSSIIEEQGKNLSDKVDIPDDIYQLKEIIGMQRVQLNERDSELEHAKASLAQARKELELTENRLGPTEQKLNVSIETIGELKTQLVQQKSEIIVKTETITTLGIKVAELQTFSKRLQDERVKLVEDFQNKQSGQFEDKLGKYISQIEDLKIENVNKVMALKEEHMEATMALKKQQSEETQELKSQMQKLEGVLLDSKLESTEAGSTAKDITTRFEEIRQKQEDLIKKVEELSEEKRLLNADMTRLNQIIDNLSTWKAQNIPKITYYDKLSILMEQEPLFKTFLVVEEVGSIFIDDLRNALGQQIVLVKKYVQKLQEIDLIETNDAGKLVPVKSEEIQ